MSNSSTSSASKTIGEQQMPVIMLGTWKGDKEKMKDAVFAALDAGYVGIDCANDYGNERQIGEALAEAFKTGRAERAKIFVQCKLWNANHRDVEGDLKASLKDLQLDYIDSFLIHWPQACPSDAGKLAVQTADGENARRAPKAEGTMLPQERDGTLCSDRQHHFTDTWRQMEALVDKGLARYIGISNFTRAQIDELLDMARIKPVVLQNESHPYLMQKDLRDYCRAHRIVFQAYSPLGGSPDQAESGATAGKQPGGVDVLEHPLVKRLAQQHNKSASQIVLRWHIDMGGAAAPKSTDAKRIADNIDIFDFQLSPADLAALDELNVGFRTVLFEDSANHPDYPFKDELPAKQVLVHPPTPKQEKA